MYSFILCIVLLILGYLIYGKIVERIFGIQPEKKTPAYAMEDGIDYVPMKGWRVFMIQFLNIAGLGPIFGAILGAKFGISAYIWIVFGCIFGGAVHDFLIGMISVRNKGASFPEIVGENLGGAAKYFMRFFTIVLLVFVGTVFVAGPAAILGSLTPSVFDALFWSAVIFLYYIVATLMPIDKIIGSLYPFFAIALLFMVFGIMVAIFLNRIPLPEFTDGLANVHPNKELSIFPMLCITIACGAVSGFHATQSPLMARCMENERQGRGIFYGAMILEGIVAMVWAAAAIYFFSPEGQAFFNPEGTDMSNPAIVVEVITKNWLGVVGGILAIIGVVAAPITSGDTAFRSARLIIADFLGVEQKGLLKRLYVAIPLFIISLVLLQLDFGIIWRYFAWSNQTLAAFALWTATVWLAKRGKQFSIALVPALFMTMVCSSYILIAPEGLRLNYDLGMILGGAITFTCLCLFIRWKIYYNKNNEMIKD